MIEELSTNLRQAAVFDNGIKFLIQESGQKFLHFILVQVSYSASCVCVCVCVCMCVYVCVCVCVCVCDR